MSDLRAAPVAVLAALAIGGCQDCPDLSDTPCDLNSYAFCDDCDTTWYCPGIDYLWEQSPYPCSCIDENGYLDVAQEGAEGPAECMEWY